jgi:hypothetical protein
MKLKDYLELLPGSVLSTTKGLFGKELDVLVPFFNEIEEFKNKTITIIEDIEVLSETTVEVTSSGYHFKQETSPELVTIMDTGLLKDEVKLYSIFSQNGNVMIRCTKDSVHV